MNNNFNLKQFLTEGTLLKEETSPLDNLEVWLKESLQDFDTNPGNPYWEGINNVLNSPKVFDYILKQCEETIKDYKEENGGNIDASYLQMILGDIIELEVMDYFWPTFIKNLEKNRITKDAGEDIFIVTSESPEFDKATPNKDYPMDNGGSYSVLDDSEVFDLLNFKSDIGENVLSSWENFLSEHEYDMYDVKYDI
jgi:hypothetical protein